MYIPHQKYQVKLHSWFSAACAAAIVHRNHVFHLYLQNKSSDSKVKFRKASNRWKKILEASKPAKRFTRFTILILHFYYYILMTFLMLSVILVSILMILFSTLSVIRHLICGNNKNWLLNLNLKYKTL